MRNILTLKCIYIFFEKYYIISKIKKEMRKNKNKNKNK
jgi:hypothetical protein